MENLQIINSAEALEVINRTEIDISISTAKQYPRDLEKSRAEILEYATASKETAQACFYALPRAGKTIEGPSVRLAEIINYSWGNINSAVRIVSNDGKKIVSQAVAHDLERNNRVMKEVSRNIVNSKGQTFTQDMQIVTGNAAGAIAWRNAIFTLIPNAVWVDIQGKIQKFITGDGNEFAKRRDALLKKFETAHGVKTDDILKRLNLATVEMINEKILIQLFGLDTALNEGTTTKEETFGTGPAKSDSPDMNDDKPADKGGELPLK